jgi:hypothetical protein
MKLSGGRERQWPVSMLMSKLAICRAIINWIETRTEFPSPLSSPAGKVPTHIFQRASKRTLIHAIGMAASKPRRGWPVYRWSQPAPRLFFCYSAARGTKMDSLVSHVRAAEKQKNKIEGDAASYKQANPTGFFHADRERNLCGNSYGRFPESLQTLASPAPSTSEP